MTDNILFIYIYIYEKSTVQLTSVGLAHVCPITKLDNSLINTRHLYLCM